MHTLSDIEAANLLGLDPLDFPSWAQGILITDGALPDNPIIYANLGFQYLTGYDRGEVIGSNCRFLQGPKTRQSTITAIGHAVRGRRRYNGDILNYRKDGTPFWNHLSMGPLNRVRTHSFFVGLQLDVSYRHLQDSFVLAH